jgi:hypothetical protein
MYIYRTTRLGNTYFWLENTNGREDLGDLGTDWIIILKSTLNK